VTVRKMKWLVVMVPLVISLLMILTGFVFQFVLGQEGVMSDWDFWALVSTPAMGVGLVLIFRRWF